MKKVSIFTSYQQDEENSETPKMTEKMVCE
jgi:hypothetical protein